MSLGRLLLVGLLLGTPLVASADPATEAKARQWIKQIGNWGGLSMPEANNDVANLLTRMGTAAKDPESFKSFRKSYYWAIGIPLAGGLDVTDEELSDRDASLRFASAFVGGNKPQQLQAFKNAFYDQVGKLTETDPDKMHAAADKIRDKLLLDLRAGKELSVSPPGNLKEEIKAWASRSGKLFGGGYQAEWAEYAGEELAKSDKQAEGREKLYALREITNLICATTLAGGVNQCKEGKPDALVAVALRILRLPGALARVQKIREDFFDWAVAYVDPIKGPASDVQKRFDEARLAKIIELFASALVSNVAGPVVTPAVGGKPDPVRQAH